MSVSFHANSRILYTRSLNISISLRFSSAVPDSSNKRHPGRNSTFQKGKPKKQKTRSNLSPLQQYERLQHHTKTLPQKENDPRR